MDWFWALIRQPRVQLFVWCLLKGMELLSGPLTLDQVLAWGGPAWERSDAEGKLLGFGPVVEAGGFCSQSFACIPGGTVIQKHVLEAAIFAVSVWSSLWGFPLAHLSCPGWVRGAPSLSPAGSGRLTRPPSSSLCVLLSGAGLSWGWDWRLAVRSYLNSQRDATVEFKEGSGGQC